MGRRCPPSLSLLLLPPFFNGFVVDFSPFFWIFQTANNNLDYSNYDAVSPDEAAELSEVKTFLETEHNKHPYELVPYIINEDNEESLRELLSFFV